MLDIKYIRENPAKFDTDIANRGDDLANRIDGLATDTGRPLSDFILEFDRNNRKAVTILQEALRTRNETTKLAEEVKASGNQAAFEQMRINLKKSKENIVASEKILKKSDDGLKKILMFLPNSPMDDVPIGTDEYDNVEISKTGEPPKFNFEAQEHFNIPSVSKGMDFETAGNISGSRFVILSGAIARVHRALAQFMLDLHINEHGLMEINAPVIVNTLAMYGTGQFPKFSEDCYKIHKDEAAVKNKYDHWLIPTSEVSLTNIVAGKILHRDQLPMRYCAHSLCFRKEAGSAGRDMAGMLRQHQFEKVEMVSITHPDESRKELDLMTERAENVLKKLGLPYRTVVLCTGDMGFSARRTHDIEVWLPGQDRYREISSVSVCGDFQARRMNARFREKDGDKPQFVHTLNGSGVAVGRCLIAVLENGQQKDGSVKLPKALHPYLGGKDTINSSGLLEKTTGK